METPSKYQMVTTPSSASRSVGSPSRINKSLAQREEEYASAFKYYDEDGDGAVDARELESILSSIGKKRTSYEMNRILFCLNSDRITMKDFLNLMATSYVLARTFGDPPRIPRRLRSHRFIPIQQTGIRSSSPQIASRGCVRLVQCDEKEQSVDNVRW